MNQKTFMGAPACYSASIQHPASVPGKATGDDPSASALTPQLGDLDEFPGFWLQPCPTLGIMVI